MKVILCGRASEQDCLHGLMWASAITLSSFHRKSVIVRSCVSNGLSVCTSILKDDCEVLVQVPTLFLQLSDKGHN